MSQKVTTVLLDDKALAKNPDSAEPATETVLFSVGSDYRAMDLNARHAAQFRAAMAPWLAIARKVAPPSRQRSRPASLRQRSADIRAWAKERGHEISERGRIPASVVEEYDRTRAA
jgi:hypothetical protein